MSETENKYPTSSLISLLHGDYPRASRMIVRLENKKIIAPYDCGQTRKVIVYKGE